jgi:CubicO group peptidase (beta-lactamase class C family)
LRLKRDNFVKKFGRSTFGILGAALENGARSEVRENSEGGTMRGRFPEDIVAEAVDPITAAFNPGAFGVSLARFVRSAALLGALLAGGAPAACFADEMQRIVDTYARPMVDDGSAVGVGVAVLAGDAPARFFSYGYSDWGKKQAFSPDTIFEIGSVTKVFTTNLLGQSVSSGLLTLEEPLSSFSIQVGQLKPQTGKVKLKELGDFTGGFPSLAPLCLSQHPEPLGCLPTIRPSVKDYGAIQFLEFFQNTEPGKYFKPPCPQIMPLPAKLPAPYCYSDFSIGLLGLLLGSYPNLPIDNPALDRWRAMVANSLAGPLGMESTYLEVPTSEASRVAGGYDRALAAATLSNGEVASINVTNHGGFYDPDAPPKVKIIGGGSGATATAVVGPNRGVERIKVSSPGSGYVAAPTVTFEVKEGEPKPKVAATAEALVSGGHVVGVNLLSGGSGYYGAPLVKITGGGGSGATATAHNANGRVVFVSVDDGGDGYQQPVAVVIEPGRPHRNLVPIWAPAGALKSTVADMANFAAAALGQTDVAGRKVPPGVTAGFKIAERAYACSGPEPDLPCRDGVSQSGLAWAIAPADSTKTPPVRAVVSKNGGLTGFSTQVDLMPDKKLAVVVFANTWQGKTDGSLASAPVIAHNILFALFYGK